MKTLQTTQKRPYTSPFIEVLEAENDMTILTTSINGQARRQNFEEDSAEDWGDVTKTNE